MARTLEEIREALYAAKDAESGLSGLSSTSATAIWKLILDVIAIGIYTHELVFDAFKAEVEAAEAKAYVGTLPWWVDKLKEFQAGDSLTTSPPFVYDPVDTDAQIIKFAAAVESSAGVTLKVAREATASGLPVALSAAQLTAVQDYVSKIKIAGTSTAIVSQDSDELYLIGTIYVDPSVIASDGSLLSDSSTFPVVDALETYLKNLPFNGRIWTEDIVDALQAVEGVEFPIITSFQAKPTSGSFASFTDYYTTESGHAVPSTSPAPAFTYTAAP